MCFKCPNDSGRSAAQERGNRDPESDVPRRDRWGTDWATASLQGGGSGSRPGDPQAMSMPRSEGDGRADPSALPSMPGRRGIVQMASRREMSATRHVARANKLRVLRMCEDAHTDAYGASANVAVGTQQRRLNAEPISIHKQNAYDGHSTGGSPSRFERQRPWGGPPRPRYVHRNGGESG